MIGRALEELNVTDYALYGDPTNEAEFNAMFHKIVGANEYNVGIMSNNPADFGITWAEVSAKVDELVAGEPLRLLREERNKRLAETDWWALSDLTMTAEQIAYRQALRDITENYTFVDDAIWPIKP